MNIPTYSRPSTRILKDLLKVRKELIKVVKSYSEDSKVSIRNVRRDANEASKKLLKKKELSSDEDKRSQDEIQKLTNEKIRIADQLLSAKENEIMTV